MKTLLVICLILSCESGLFSQLKLENIMKGNEFLGNLPSNHFWSWDNKRIYFDWNPENELGNSTYFWEKRFEKPQKLAEKEQNELFLSDKRQIGKKMRYYIKNGALFSFDTQQKTHIKRLQSAHPISELIILKNSENIYFIQENNIFRFNPITNSCIQITNFQKGIQKPKDGEQTFLEQQQSELFLYIQDKHKKEQWRKSKQNKEHFPAVIYLGNQELEELTVSEDEKFITFRLSTYPENLETKVENYVSKTGYSTASNARSKVSIKALSSHKLGVFNIEKDSSYFISFEKLSDLKKNPAYLSIYPNFKENADKERAVLPKNVIYSENGENCVFEVRSLDNKDRWIVSLNLTNGEIEELEHQYDGAWIGGPGISEWNFEHGTLGFLKDNETIYFQSEESGFSHLYTLNVNTKVKNQLTSGNWEVRDVTLSQNKDCFYFIANKSHPGNREFYKLDLKSNKLEPLLVGDGAVDVQLSPDEKSLAVLYSFKNKPWELYSADNKTNASKKQITFSTTKSFNEVSWINPEVITFDASDKTKINARLYQGKNKNGAAVIFVHGAGYLQNAHNYWSSYYREFMFHNLLVEKGYTVLDIDYRASEGYGRDFRTGIYRHMGGLDLSDQLDGKKLLVEKYGIDANRVGIYGGSYGGFITLMALLTKPGEFKCGAALRSVTDWAHYNVEYTSNILNFPETDPEAFRKSSPIYFAENLQDKLLMLHGMVDDNVQFQDVVRLSQRFIELGKDNWELAVFPVEAHGFKESYSWLDEYKRILKLFEENLK